jgi:hypothetical protein
MARMRAICLEQARLTAFPHPLIPLHSTPLHSIAFHYIPISFLALPLDYGLWASSIAKILYEARVITEDDLDAQLGPPNSTDKIEFATGQKVQVSPSPRFPAHPTGDVLTSDSSKR